MDVRGFGIHSGHHVDEENPEALAAAIQAFLSPDSSVDRYDRQKLAALVHNLKKFPARPTDVRRRPLQLGAEKGLGDRVAHVGQHYSVPIEKKLLALADVEVEALRARKRDRTFQHRLAPGPAERRRLQFDGLVSQLPQGRCDQSHEHGRDEDGQDGQKGKHVVSPGASDE